jgi:Rrf2 family iron-sulfur cluster assembly transcriptional regulator
MVYLPRKPVLALAAVIDIALHDKDGPVSSKEVARRNGLPPRHFEPVLQALVREGILRGVRGPGGGYTVARSLRDITAREIIEAAGIEGDDLALSASSSLIDRMVMPAISKAEQAFAQALIELNVADLVRRASAAAN